MLGSQLLLACWGHQWWSRSPPGDISGGAIKVPVGGLLWVSLPSGHAVLGEMNGNFVVSALDNHDVE